MGQCRRPARGQSRIRRFMQIRCTGASAEANKSQTGDDIGKTQLQNTPPPEQALSTSASWESALSNGTLPSPTRELQLRISRDTRSLQELWVFVRSELSRLDEGHTVACLGRAAALGCSLNGLTSPQPELENLLQQIQSQMEAGHLPPISIAKIAHASAEISLAPHGIVKCLVVETERRASELAAVDAAMLARAFARLRRPDSVSALVTAIVEQRAAFGTQALVNMIWSAATAQVSNCSPVMTLIDEAVQRGERLRPQAIANIVWALGTLRQRDRQVLDTILPFVSHRHRDLTPQGVAMSFWGLAALRRPGAVVGWLEEDVVLRLALQAVRDVEHLSGQELTSIARAVVSYAPARTRAGNFAPLVDAAVGEALRRLDHLETRHLAGLLWALARLRGHDNEAAAQMATAASQRAGPLRAQEVGSLSWAVATMKIRHGPLLTALRARTKSLELEGFRVPFRVISGLVWAHAVLRERDATLLKDGLAEVAAARCGEGTPQELANLAWAMVLLGVSDPDLLRAVVMEAMARSRVAAQECANLAWAVASAQVADERVMDALGRSFLADATRPLAEEGCGRDWAVMVDALVRSNTGARCLQGTPRGELLAAYEEAVFEPVAQRLRAVRSGDSDEIRLLRSLEDMAKSLGLGHLGASHTREVLRRAGLSDAEPSTEGEGIGETPWIALARKAAASGQSQEAVVGRPPHQRDVVAWISYSALVRLGALEELVLEPGRVVRFGALPGGELRPVSFDHNRSGHAERVALLSVLDSVRASEKRLRRRTLSQPSAIDAGPASLATEVVGHVRLFATHTPCISCLAVLAQFSRRLPNLSIAVAFDDARLMAAASGPGDQ